MKSQSLLSSIALLSLGSGLVSAQCEVYGIDFVNGGSYFQDINSTSPFTCVQEFSGCQNDTANNILVDPNGDQSECSDTPLTPDYTPETVTCSDWPEDKLYSGDWSLIVISNNGDGDPIAYQRDFSLSVGIPSTTTVTPTVIATEIDTVVSSVYSTTTKTVTTTLIASTKTKKALIAVALPTLTSRPLHVQAVTNNLFTVTKTAKVPQVTQTTVQATPTCKAPSPNWIADPIAKIEVTIVKSLAQQVYSAKFRRALVEKEAMNAEIKKDFVVERAARLASANDLRKRAPDASIVTSTATTGFITSTTTQYTTVTSTFPTTALVTSTSTPAVVTVTKALVNIAALETKILAAMTVTLTNWDAVTTTKTKNVPWTVTVTSTSTPTNLAVACASTGGTLS